MGGRLGELLDGAVESGARVGACVMEAGIERAALDAGGLYPLASVRKVVTLGAYALAVAGGRLDPAEPVPIGDIEEWWWPGTDGGAHVRARQCWTGDTMTLDEVAEAMIRYSDNACSDYLLDRVGTDGIASFARRTALRVQEPIHPVLGEFRAWHRSLDRWVTLDAGQRATEAWRDARTRPPAGEDPELDEAAQRRGAAVSCRGTPREWAGLMARLTRGTGLPPAATDLVHRLLEIGGVTEDPADGCFGRKGGDLPGVVAFAGYVRGRAGRGPDVTVALFLRGLSDAWQARLVRVLPQSGSELLALAGVVDAAAPRR